MFITAARTSILLAFLTAGCGGAHVAVPAFSCALEGDRAVAWLRGAAESQLLVGVRLPSADCTSSSESSVDLRGSDEGLQGRIDELLTFRQRGEEDGEVVRIRLFTDDESQPLDLAMTVGDQALRLQDGRLLFIDARSEPVQVVQLQTSIELAQLDQDVDAGGASTDDWQARATEVLRLAAGAEEAAAFFR